MLFKMWKLLFELDDQTGPVSVIQLTVYSLFIRQ